MQADTNVEEGMDYKGSKPTDNNSIRNEDYENKQKPALEKPLERSQGELLIEELEENFAKDKKGYKKAKSGIMLFAQNSFHNNSSSPSAMVFELDACHMTFPIDQWQVIAKHQSFVCHHLVASSNHNCSNEQPFATSLPR